jgi:uncharacterized membrane protein YjfL (UPF0719 family)
MSTSELAFVVVAVVCLLALARWLLQWLFGNSLRLILTDHDNVAVGLVVAGYLFAVVWTVTVLLGAPSKGLWQDVLNVLRYGGLGILLLTVVTLVSCRFFLGLRVRKQLRAHNVAAGIVVAGVYVATSMTYSGALAGEGGGWWVFLLFFILGQLALLGITYLFRWLTVYDDVQEIAGGNVAAALALAGLLIAVGVVIGRVAGGVYTGLLDSLTSFLVAIPVVFVFYPVRQLVVQCLILGGRLGWRSTLLDSEIAEDGNVAAGLLEGTAYLATGLFVFHMI